VLARGEVEIAIDPEPAAGRVAIRSLRTRLVEPPDTGEPSGRVAPHLERRSWISFMFSGFGSNEASMTLVARTTP